MDKFIFDLQRFAEIRYTTTDGMSETIDIGGATSITASTFVDAGVKMTKLKTVEIPDGVTTIVNEAFNNCSSLTTIELPESLTSIGDNAFNECSSLTTIELPESLTSIGNFAFDGTNLTSIIFTRDTPPTFGNDVFGTLGAVKIHVPKDSVDDYKVADNITSTYDDNIEGYTLAWRVTGDNGNKVAACYMLYGNNTDPSPNDAPLITISGVNDNANADITPTIKDTKN